MHGRRQVLQAGRWLLSLDRKTSMMQETPSCRFRCVRVRASCIALCVRVVSVLQYWSFCAELEGMVCPHVDRSQIQFLDG